MAFQVRLVFLAILALFGLTVLANAGLVETSSANPFAQVRSIEARGVDPGDYYCGNQLSWFYWARFNGEVDQANYLYGLGTDTCGAKAHSCSRVSCSYNNAIFLCNDNDYEIGVPCNHIAEYADWIMYIPACQRYDGKVWWSLGQVFDRTGGWNVIVRYDKC